MEHPHSQNMAARTMVPGLMARPSPHKLLFMALQVMLGAIFVAGVPAPTSLAATQPLLIVRLWAVSMLVAGMVGLVANACRRLSLFRALQMERAAMDLGIVGLLFYAATLIGYAGLVRALTGVLFLIVWSVANLWRRLQIRHDLRELAAHESQSLVHSPVAIPAGE